MEDDRTVAQLAVGQVEFADAIIVAGAAADVDTARRTDAVLDRLVPGAPRVRAARFDVEALLAAVPVNSRRGRVDDSHAVLTHHTYPWHTERGIGWDDQFEDRDHDVLGTLLDLPVTLHDPLTEADTPELGRILASTADWARWPPTPWPWPASCNPPVAEAGTYSPEAPPRCEPWTQTWEWTSCRNGERDLGLRPHVATPGLSRSPWPSCP